MESQNDAPAAAVIDHYLVQLRVSISDVLNNEIYYRRKNQELTTDVQAFKAAYTSVELDRRNLEQKYENKILEIEKERQDLEKQLLALKFDSQKASERSDCRVICLIDGDGTIFSPDLIAKGQEGGHLAAKMLSDSIRKDPSFGALDQFQLWVYAFFNKRGLLEVFGRQGLWEAKTKFDDFIIGFNQSAERFSIIDVGNGKEAADAKIKVYLEDNIRLQQTYKIVFGGCHDNGYVTTLRSVITAGYHEKLILLRGYSEMAAGIDELTLPSLHIPDLFIPQKFVNTSATHTPPGLPSTLARRKSRSQSVSSTKDRQVFHPHVPSTTPSEVDSKPEPSIPTLIAPPGLLPNNYTALQAPQAIQIRPDTPELDSESSSDFSDISDPFPLNLRNTAPVAKSRHINPDIPLSKHKPPPCTLFYLADCKHGASCKYGHDYILETEHYATIRQNAKKAPCPAANRGEECSWGELECIYGHVCPQLSQCYYFKQGRCKFVAENMHPDTS